MNGSGRIRRGMTLLLIMVILVVAVPAAVYAARTKSERQLHDRITVDRQLARDLVVATDPLISSWLERESMSVVLPFHATRPMLGIAKETWSARGRPVAVQISAWDLRGMVPLRVLQHGLGFDTVVERRVVEAIEEAHRAMPLDGLDMICAVEGVRVFPRPSGSTNTSLAVGELVDCRDRTDPAFNVHTAPARLLSAAFRAAGRSGIDVVAQARFRGEQIVSGQIPNPERPSSASVRLISASDAWAFRTDVYVGLASMSWWAVYERTGESWRCTQRIQILDE